MWHSRKYFEKSCNYLSAVLSPSSGNLAFVSVYEGDYSKIGGLSNEIVTRLTRTKPLTIGAMTRMMGITPAAVTAVIAYLKKK